MNADDITNRVQTLRNVIVDSRRRIALEKAANALDYAARHHGLNSPEYKAAKAEHARLCKALGY